MMEDERNKKQETVPAPTDDDEKGIYTKAFLMTEMKFGLDFVFRMSDSILPFVWLHLPAFYCKGLVGESKKMVSMEDYKGAFLVLVFYPKDFTDVGDATLNLILGSWWGVQSGAGGNLYWFCADTQGLDREGGAPVAMLGDMTGNMARMFGGLDTTHTAYSSMFLVDTEGVVNALKLTGKGGLGVGGVGDVLDLVRDSFTVDVKTEDVDSCE